MSTAYSKPERQEELQRIIQVDPFLTDEELADHFGVSVQTIRLDRMSLGIPELRKRTRKVAQRAYGQVKTLASQEIIGELVNIELGKSGTSIMETTRDMVFEKTRIVRSHFILAQADSLALAIIDSDVALTGLANVKYRRPVKVGERLVARAEVIRIKGPDKFVVLVETFAGDEQVFRGKFVVFAVEQNQV